MFQFGPKKHKTDEPIFFDGFCYSRSKKSDDNNTIYVECHDRISKKCPARGILNTEGSRVLLTTNHKHARNFDDHVIYTFKRDLYRAVTSSYRDLRLIYDEITIRHADAATLVPYISIVKTMQTWRKNNRPPVPKTLQEYVERLNSDYWRKFFIPPNSNLTVINVRGTDGSVATVFIDANLLQNFQSVHLYADATYKICPQEPKNKIYQFFTIMATFDDTYK
ncbi:uncharacterized protein LOC130673324 [Microplitis mediator]|uniref:uncharacterized protein LOC130673324 n=1 Tax=Microplitis mediator TaxID=375433 RepID=UPI002555A310|nr:uncharacterized protein LOC130673324 [Microplitis mediator]